MWPQGHMKTMLYGTTKNDMTYDGGFIMQKAVDWLLLRSSSARLLPKGRKNDGMTIPVSACAMLNVWDESILTNGASKDIKVLIDVELYDARLKNQNFEQSNWAGHKDVILIRYGRQSAERRRSLPEGLNHLRSHGDVTLM